jgi:hypothetical protein
MERQRGAKPNCRVIRREIRAERFDVHACQYRLTSLICQPKLTQQIATPECPRCRASTWASRRCNSAKATPERTATKRKNTPKPADALLVAIELGGIDVAVPKVERPPHGVYALAPVPDLPHPQGKYGDLAAIGQRARFHCRFLPPDGHDLDQDGSRRVTGEREPTCRSSLHKPAGRARCRADILCDVSAPWIVS